MNKEKENPYLTTSELGIHVFNKNTGKSSREIYNEDDTLQDLCKTGRGLRAMLFSDKTDDEVRELINECIKEFRRKECNKTNCGYNHHCTCTLETPNRNFDNCNDFYTVE